MDWIGDSGNRSVRNLSLYAFRQVFRLKGGVAKLETPCVTGERIGDISKKFAVNRSRIDVFRSLFTVTEDA